MTNAEIEELRAATEKIVGALRGIGVGDSTPGGLEFLGMKVRDDLAPSIFDGLSEIATALSMGLTEIASAIVEHK